MNHHSFSALSEIQVVQAQRCSDLSWVPRNCQEAQLFLFNESVVRSKIIKHSWRLEALPTAWWLFSYDFCGQVTFELQAAMTTLIFIQCLARFWKPFRASLAAWLEGSFRCSKIKRHIWLPLLQCRSIPNAVSDARYVKFSYCMNFTYVLQQLKRNRYWTDFRFEHGLNMLNHDERYNMIQRIKPLGDAKWLPPKGLAMFGPGIWCHPSCSPSHWQPPAR